MARHGENIRKRSDGRWEGRYLVKRGEEKSYVSVYDRSYDEVKKKLLRQKNILNGLIIPAGAADSAQCRLTDILFTDAADEWLENVKETRKPSTYEKYRAVYHKHLKIIASGLMVSDITEQLVREAVPNTLEESLAKSIYCVLNQILKFASRRHSVHVAEIKKPDLNLRSKPARAFTRKEQSKLISVLHQEMDIFKLAVLLCLYIGLRLGELCALKWSDIDFGNGTLSVRRTVQRLHVESGRTKTALVETEPKSESSSREIPLSDDLLKFLLGFQNNKEYIFGGDGPADPRTVQNHFKKILKEAGVESKNFHMLRHTFATNCIEKSVDPKSLSEILGHSNVGITLNRYVHPSMDTKRKHLDSLSVFYGQIHGQAGQ